MHHRQSIYHAQLLCGVAAASLIAAATSAQAETRFDIQPQPLKTALAQFGAQSGLSVLVGSELTNSRSSPGYVGMAADPETALQYVLAGTDLLYCRDRDTYIIVPALPCRQVVQGDEGGSADVSGGDVEALIVTAQKREENIQDVPIAISAFSQEDLTTRQVAGGPDLMTQVPNMTFTKTNFSSYSIQIRGIGTQAISATTDPAVAVAFNNTPFIHNRFFEQEFYDLERVEVLRGPQGTLYGRNATAGVVNLISAKPTFHYEAKAAADVANYSSMRLEGMVNMPLIEDVAALRVAGAWTKRDGYVTNQITGNPIDGRDLWSTRVSLRVEPSDWVSANLVWEHFEEDDDRLRSGKQLCKRDPSKTSLAGVAFPVESAPGENSSAVGTYNQGCLPSSLYSPDSFETPNGFALPYYQPLAQLGLPTVRGLDPYLSTTQSSDLRVIESTVDPSYRARSDVAELQMNFEIDDNLTLTSETAYSVDELFSTQDYNRFNTAPGAFDQARWDTGNQRPGVLQDGVFCDPQIGCADRLVAVDLSTANSRQFSQELRLSSDFDGRFNFSLGANFLRFDTTNKYYVFINTLSLWAARNKILGGPPLVPGPYIASESDNSECFFSKGDGGGYLMRDPSLIYGVQGCILMDPNPIGSLNDLGHNYFLSKNPYRLISYAAFGEIYYDIADDLKVTAGLRWTVDKKHAPSVPSWLLAANSVGHPVKEIVDSEWREPTGRLAIDWKPELSFTDETLLYASYARGYKAGGANPPPMVVVMAGESDRPDFADSVLHPKTFDAEYVDAFEAGAKNTLLNGALTLNLGAFYYDYKGYQISQIIDRTAVNSNFDTEVWGLELEADWRPTESLRLGLKLGYEDTRVADGEQAVDVINRTAGHTDWVVAKPFPSLASNCILPVSLVTFNNRINTLNRTGSVSGDVGFCARAYIMGLDPITALEYQPNPTQAALGMNGSLVNLATYSNGYWAGYPGFDPKSAPNNGEGFFTDLSGNELPNSPHYTATLTADYFVPLPSDWSMNLHTDIYYQSEAWTRIFNLEGYDKLKAYSNINLAAIFTNENAGWKVMAYVKNVLDRDSITGAFLNSDDSGLTTNVFLTEPRLYGIRLTKAWEGGHTFGRWPGQRRAPGKPHAFTIEVSGGANQLQSSTEIIEPDWLSTYASSHPFPFGPQNQEIERGDQREVRATYAPGAWPEWRISGGYRWGDAKSTAFGQDSDSIPFCGTILGTAFCVPVPPVVWASASAQDREEYEIADLAVGREVGASPFGARGSSVVSIGVRQVELTSWSHVEHRGSPDHFIPNGIELILPPYQLHWHNYTDQIEADRSFRGLGPVISWEVSVPLKGDAQTGVLALDWNLSGGVLFGEQKVDVRQERTLLEMVGGYNQQVTTTTVTDSILRMDKQDVEVPVAGVGLGLTYSVDWLKVGAGYRWDRYFDAIDGGAATPSHFDRTIEGPYFKLAIGFGG